MPLMLHYLYSYFFTSEWMNWNMCMILISKAHEAGFLYGPWIPNALLISVGVHTWLITDLQHHSAYRYSSATYSWTKLCLHIIKLYHRFCAVLNSLKQINRKIMNPADNQQLEMFCLYIISKADKLSVWQESYSLNLISDDFSVIFTDTLSAWCVLYRL